MPNPALHLVASAANADETTGEVTNWLDTRYPGDEFHRYDTEPLGTFVHPFRSPHIFAHRPPILMSYDGHAVVRFESAKRHSLKLNDSGRWLDSAVNAFTFVAVISVAQVPKGTQYLFLTHQASANIRFGIRSEPSGWRVHFRPAEAMKESSFHGGESLGWHVLSVSVSLQEGQGRIVVRNNGAQVCSESLGLGADAYPPINGTNQLQHTGTDMGAITVIGSNSEDEHIDAHLAELRYYRSEIKPPWASTTGNLTESELHSLEESLMEEYLVKGQ